MTPFAGSTDSAAVLLAAGFWIPDAADMSRLGPFWCLIGTLVVLLLGPLVYGRRAAPTGAVAALGALATAFVAWRLIPTMSEGGWAGFAPDGRPAMLLADPFSLFAAMLISLFLAGVSLLWLLGSRASSAPADMHANAPEFFTLLVASAVGMLMMVSTTHLLMIVIAVEMASLPSYGLAGFEKRQRLGAEASLKYVLFGGITSAIMIYGISLLYGFYKTFDLTVIAAELARGGGGALPAVALIALLVGVGFKISAVPFHFWCPDVFQGAAIEVTTWLSVASKAAGLGLLLRIVSLPAAIGMEAETARWLSLGIGAVAAVTCTVGNFCALHQTNVKRLLAYSSIAHAGYMLMAGAIIVRAEPSAAHPAFAALIAYLVVYMFMNLGAFGCAAMVYWDTGKDALAGYNGLGRRNPFLAVVMTICLVSLVGLPPLGGFAAKYWLLVNVFDAGLIWLVVVAVLNTALSLYYYMRVVRQMFLMDDGQPAVSAPLGGLALVGVCAAVILWTGTLAIGTLRSRAEGYARQLYVGRPAQATAALFVPPAEATRADGKPADEPQRRID